MELPTSLAIRCVMGRLVGSAEFIHETLPARVASSLLILKVHLGAR